MKNRFSLSQNSWQMCFLTLAVVMASATTTRLLAEIWTDNTGNFKIDAEFVALQGDKVVLKKPNGATVEVPLRRLNATGQELAKRLASKPATSTPAAPLTPRPSAPVTTSSSGSQASGSQAPDAYLRELMAASEAGDYQKMWNALPSAYQKDVHDIIHHFAENMDPMLWKQGSDLLKKAVKVLKDKRQFILAHPVVASKPEVGKALPPLSDALDAVVNSELSDLQKLKTFDFLKFASGDGKKIAEKMKIASEATKDLQKMVPPGVGGVPGAPNSAANPFSDFSGAKPSDVKIIVVKHEGDSAVLKFEIKGKPTPEGEKEWQRVEGKWLPKEMVAKWQEGITEAKQWIAGEMKQKVQQSKAQVGFILAPVNMTLDQLLAAQSQQQFDQVIMNLMAQFGAGGPGTPPGAPAPPGAPRAPGAPRFQTPPGAPAAPSAPPGS